MNINLKLTGDAEKAIENIIQRGRAATKTEAVRLALLDYDEHHLKDDPIYLEVAQDISNKIKQKKMKTYSEKEIMDALG